MAGPDDVHHVQVALLDDAIQVDIDEVQAWGRAPMAEQPWLDVFFLQRLFQERVIQEVDLPHGKVIRRAPPGVHLAEEIGGQLPFAWG